MARRKSINDVRMQTRRINAALYNRYGDMADMTQRYQRANRAERVYTNNIARAIGGRWAGVVGGMSQIDQDRQVPRNVYMGLNEG